MDVDWSQTIIAKMNPSASTKTGTNLGPWGPPWLSPSQSGRLIYTPYAQPLTELIDLIGETGAAYLSVTPCIVEALVETSRNFNKPVRLDSVLLRGGQITDYTNQIVADELGARTIGLYSSKEAGAIASPCPSGDGYHVNDESVLVEIVDDSGKPVKAGQEGRVIVTPFTSTAVPLLRYDQGDMAIMSDGCSCGRTLMHLKKITGRVRSAFRHPDGRATSRELPMDCRKMLGASRLQIIQTGPTNFTVRYIAKDWNVPIDHERFKQRFREIFFPDAVITLVEVDDFVISETGKFQERICDWNPKLV